MVKASCSVIGHVPLGCCGAREQRSAPRDEEEQHQTAEEIQKDLGEFGAALAVGREIVIGEIGRFGEKLVDAEIGHQGEARSEEHTSELQSLMRISYAVLILKKKRK